MSDPACFLIVVARSEAEPSGEDERRGNLITFWRNCGLHVKSGVIAALRYAHLAHLSARNDGRVAFPNLFGDILKIRRILVLRDHPPFVIPAPLCHSRESGNPFLKQLQIQRS